MGSTFRFVHCADLHLGSAVHAKGREGALLESLHRIVDLAVSERADALFISGDVYDSAAASPSARHALASELSRFRGRVLIARGNHDSVAPWDDSIPYPPNVHEFPAEPESVVVDTAGGQFEAVGVSFQSQHEGRDLASMLRGRGDMFTVACVHCDAGGSPGYAPFDPPSLAGRGVDYWALGHIHKRQVLSRDPWAVYPGNIQGRDMGETGEKGAYLVTVTDGRVSEARFVPTQTFCFRELSADIAGRTFQEAEDELRAQVSEGDVARITFTGTGAMDGMLRSDPSDVARSLGRALRCTVQEVRVRTLPEGSPGPVADAVASKAEEMAALPRAEIMGILMSKPLLRQNRAYFESLSDEEFYGMVSGAAGLASSALGGQR
jgi:DNA repair exonuclease SbcCD nuclease subunit